MVGLSLIPIVVACMNVVFVVFSKTHNWYYLKVVRRRGGGGSAGGPARASSRASFPGGRPRSYHEAHSAQLSKTLHDTPASSTERIGDGGLHPFLNHFLANGDYEKKPRRYINDSQNGLPLE